MWREARAWSDVQEKRRISELAVHSQDFHADPGYGMRPPDIMGFEVEHESVRQSRQTCANPRHQPVSHFGPRRLRAGGSELRERELEIFEVDRHFYSYRRTPTMACSSSRRSVIRPVRTRVFTVPSGKPNRSANSDWVSPRK